MLIYQFYVLLAKGVYKADCEEFPFDIDYSQHIWTDLDIDENDWMMSEEIEFCNDGIYTRIK